MNSMLSKILYFALHGLTFKVNSPSSVDNENLCLIWGSRPTLLGSFLYTFSLVLVDILQMKQSCTTKPTSTSGIASFLVKSATKNSNFILKQKDEFKRNNWKPYLLWVKGANTEFLAESLDGISTSLYTKMIQLIAVYHLALWSNYFYFTYCQLIWDFADVGG